VFVENGQVHGIVKIDARALGVSLLNVDNANHDATQPFTVHLMPGNQHYFYSGGALQYFTVANDGSIDYDPALEGALTGRGTSTLVINGRTVQIDARPLGVGSLVLDSVGYDARAPISRNLLPGQHLVYTSFASGSPAYFTVATLFRSTVANDGSIDYDPALEGALTGRGTSTLVINGRTVTLDARALGVGSLVLDYAGYDATAPISRNLLPGQHLVYTSFA